METSANLERSSILEQLHILRDKAFKTLTLRIEVLNYSIPLPVSIYFGLIIGAFRKEDYDFGITVGSAMGLIFFILAFFWRKYKFRRIFSLDGADLGENLQRIKKELLAYPRYEAFSIALRWILGFTLAHLVYIYWLGFNWVAHRSVPVIWLIVLPVSCFAALLLGEGVVRRILLEPPLDRVELPEKSGVKHIGYFPRILFAVFSLTLMPLTVLGYLVYILGVPGYQEKYDIGNPMIHVAIIVGMYGLQMFITTYLLARAARGGLEETGRTLNELGKGNLSVTSIPVSADDFGDLAYHLGEVIKRLRANYEEINEMNINLEDKVEERTLQLKQSLESINALKDSQDGDYYLTSLLLQPLGSNQVKSDVVDVQVAMEQFKQFHFRKRDVEIGGDICAAHTIELRGKKYTVVLNGDAMGKSIQGAGGALVLGSVFKGILTSPRMRDLHPEEWLRDCYIELQNVFISFEGTMMISAVIGLVDDETGMFYSFNAEHPWPVLYRQGRTRFLSGPTNLHKIGVSGLGGVFRILTHQLLPGDIVFLGSDGRDDLLMGLDKDGLRIINEDENEILNRIVEGEGALEKCVASIKESGDYADDFSLMRIAYREGEIPEAPAKEVDKHSQLSRDGLEALRDGNLDEAQELLQRAYLENPSSKRIVRALAQFFINQKNYKSAAVFYERYTEIVPGDTMALYYTSYACKRGGEYVKAIIFADRCRLRDPEHLNNLINLADVYRLKGEKREGRKVLDEINKISPNNKKARIIGDRMKSPRERSASLSTS